MYICAPSNLVKFVCSNRLFCEEVTDDEYLVRVCFVKCKLDEGIPIPHVVPVKVEVKPNFWTPPS